MFSRAYVRMCFKLHEKVYCRARQGPLLTSAWTVDFVEDFWRSLTLTDVNALCAMMPTLAGTGVFKQAQASQFLVCYELVADFCVFGSVLSS